jgi:hypothetical protein
LISKDLQHVRSVGDSGNGGSGVWRGRLGRSRNAMSHLGGLRSKNGHTQSIGKSNRNRLDAARLVCMTKVSDLPNPVAGCRRLAGMRMLRRNAMYGPQEKATAL